MATNREIEVFHKKIEAGNLEEVNDFIKLHPNDIDARSGIDKNTGLIVAALYGNPRIIDLLLAAGADPAARNLNGASPLSIALLDDNYSTGSAILTGMVKKYLGNPKAFYDELATTRCIDDPILRDTDSNLEKSIKFYINQIKNDPRVIGPATAAVVGVKNNIPVPEPSYTKRNLQRKQALGDPEQGF